MRSVAAEQGGVITAEQCRGLGGDDGAIRSLLGAGAWHRARRGVYRDARPVLPGGVDAPFVARCAALLASLHGPAVVSHSSAARLLGLPLPPAGAGHGCI
jgi:predicted transcriptional regulator of viral defense system